MGSSRVDLSSLLVFLTLIVDSFALIVSCVMVGIIDSRFEGIYCTSTAMGLNKTQRGLALCDCRPVALYHRPLPTIKWDGLGSQFLIIIFSNMHSYTTLAVLVLAISTASPALSAPVPALPGDIGLDIATVYKSIKSAKPVGRREPSPSFFSDIGDLAGTLENLFSSLDGVE